MFQFAVLAWTTLLLVACDAPPPHAVVTSWHRDGKAAAVAVLRGQDTVLVRRWHSNGIRLSETPYQNNRPHGDYIQWSWSGDLQWTGSFYEGTRNGTWTEWFSENHPRTITNWKLGTPVAPWVHVRADGIAVKWNGCLPSGGAAWDLEADGFGRPVRLRTCQDTVTHGLNVQFQFLMNAQKTWPRRLDSYAIGQKHGLGATWDSLGIIRQIHPYQQGLRHGLWIWFDKAGNAQRTAWFDQGNGTVPARCPEDCAETTFVNGQRIRSIAWRSDSLGQSRRLASITNYQNGKADGLRLTWWPNGARKDSLQYRNGELFGTQFHFDTTGRLYMKKHTRGKAFPVHVELVPK